MGLRFFGFQNSGLFSGPPNALPTAQTKPFLPRTAVSKFFWPSTTISASRDIDAGAPHRPGVDLSGGQRGGGVRWVEINEFDLRAVYLVLLECRHQQEFAQPRAVHRDRLADEILDLVDTGIVLGDDRGGARLVDHELGEYQRRPGDDGGQRRRGRAAEAEIGAAAGYGLQRRRVVREPAQPFDLDAVLCQQLFELAALLGDQVETAQPPGQADLVSDAAFG